MTLELRSDRRSALLGRGEVFPPIEAYVEKALRQIHVPIPLVTGRAGIGRTAVLHELSRRQTSVGRSVGMGEVRSGLGQALTDATLALTEAMGARRPGSPALARLVAAQEAFAKKRPDEGTEDLFTKATDYLIYALSRELNDVPGGFLILIDDVHLANQRQFLALVDGLVASSSTGAPVPFVFSRSSDVPSGRLSSELAEHALRPLADSGLADLAQRYGIAASPEVLRLIGLFADGLPGRAMQVFQRCSQLGSVNAHTVRQVIEEASARLAEPMLPLLRLADLTPTQVRTLEKAHDLHLAGTLSLSQLRRLLGEVSRFGGAASPVADSAKHLVEIGLLNGSGDRLEMTEAGVLVLQTNS